MKRLRRISLAEHQWRSCDRKIRHASREAAELVQTQIYENERDVVTRYPCQFCKGWHLGHTGRGATKRIRKRLEKARRRRLWKPLTVRQEAGKTGNSRLLPERSTP